MNGKKLEFLVIHCTATPEGRPHTGNDIRLWHTLPIEKGGRGWKQVGYSDVILLDGEIQNLVPYNTNEVVETSEMTNGVAGINGIARHIVYVGGLDAHTWKPKDTRTRAQRLALEFIVRRTLLFHPEIKIGGHNQFDAGKACPSFDVPNWLKSIEIPEKNILRR